MKELDSLASAERELLASLPMPGIDSGIDEKERLRAEAAIFEESRRIYSCYVALAEKGDLEALKRALFYAWYQLSEPYWLSGISELPDKETQAVVDLLESALEQGIRDIEIDYMLPHYMAVCSYYLERFYPIPYIQSASVKDPGNTKEKARNGEHSWAMRGQMGEYWAERA